MCARVYRPPHRRAANAPGAMLGFSMLELLVAMLVVGVGVLGVLGLGMASLQQARSAASQAEAVRLAGDLVERIRANPAGLAAGAYALAGDAPAAPDCTSRHCTPAQIAAADLRAWSCALGAAEPGECPSPIAAQAEVAVEVATGQVMIAIAWRDAGGERTLTLRSRG